MQIGNPISLATTLDLTSLEILVNSAYRGESSRKGWTTEADLLQGIRTDRTALNRMIQNATSCILKFTGTEGDIQGCVYLEKKSPTLYLGMLTVAPELQDRGIGKQLLQAAENYAKTEGFASISMTVISVRYALIGWYERHGYYPTGETRPFPDNPKFGIPQKPLYFRVLEKQIL